MSLVHLAAVDAALAVALQRAVPSGVRVVSGPAPLLDRGDVDVVIVDLATTAFERISAWTRQHASTPVVVLAPLGGVEAAVRAMRAGAFDVVPHPVDPRLLALSVERALGHRQDRLELERLRRSRPGAAPAGIIGNSAPMERLLTLVERMARVDSAVLLVGESGVGKELIARALHERAVHRSGPFVAVNCAALPEALLESELFGHVRGAFTDARSSRPGLLAQARGGTLLLDEIGDLPMPLQPKLLRVLQERKVRPVGGDVEQDVDVRVIAATHRDLDALVKAGRFREDLLYRLDVLRLDIPPLRSRGADILTLAHVFLQRHAHAHQVEVPRLDPEVARILLQHSWPGNVRELQNAMERAMALCEDGWVRPSDLPPRLQRLAVSPDASSDGLDAEELPTLARVEEAHIRRVLRAVDGNRSRAARILGLDRKTLWRRLKALGED